VTGPARLLRVSPAGRRGRAAATLLAGGVLLLGSWRGSDDHFPFGPFLMFAGRNPPTLDVPSAFVQAVTSTGHVVTVSATDSGLRRAELEGQLASLQRDPAQLRDIAVAHRRRNPDEPVYVEIRVVQRRFHLRDRRLSGHSDVILAAWRQP
jgi:hypothetical protein